MLEGKVLKGGIAADKGELHGAGGAVALLADDQFGQPFFGVIFSFVIDLVAVDETANVGVLFNALIGVLPTH
jgi:hypothetical protein